MSDGQSRYVEAAQSDVDRMKRELDKVRASMGSDGENSKSDSEVLETAWQDLQDQWSKLQEAGGTASSELQEGFNGARDRFQRVLDTYRNS